MTGYRLEGASWPGRVATWSFATYNYPADASRAFTSAITDPTEQAVMEAAFARWQQVSGITFLQVPDSGNPATPADIRVGFANLGSALGNADAIGLTTYFTSGGSFAPDVTVQFEDPSLDPLVTDANGRLAWSGTVSEFYQVALHEIGHAIGLAHDNSDPSAVMYPVAQTTNEELGPDDILGAQALYGPPPLQDVQLQGVGSQYVIAQSPQGWASISDLVPGRDGSRLIPNVHDFVFADGAARFDATGNAEDVTRLYHVAFARLPDPGGLDYWSNALDGGTATISTAALGFVASPEFLARYGALDNAGFVGVLYQNAFGRPADPGGAAYWTADLNAGGSRASVLLAFANSLEERTDLRSVAGDRDDAEAWRLYQAALDRTPDPGGLDYWSNALESGAAPVGIAQSLAASPEFLARYGALDNAGFVGVLYQNTFGRPADPGGAAYWTADLNAGDSRSDVLLAFADSLESRIRTAPETHDAWVSLRQA